MLTLSLARMNRLLELDEESQIATFGPGANGPQVESQLRARGYTLGHFPQSWELSTLGGWVASRSSGQQSLRYGRIEQLFAGGTLETFAGPMELPTFPASAAGPDLREMVLGSEGRFGVISEVRVRVTRLAEQESFHAVFLPNWNQALKGIRSLAQARVPLSMLRLSNAIETETQLALAGHPGQIALLEKYLALRGAGAGKCMLTFGVTGNRAQNAASLRQARRLLKGFGGVFTGTLLGKKWEHNRFRFPYLRHALWSAGYVVDTLETATDWSNVDNLLDKIEASLRTGLKEEGERVHVFTHLSHVYGEGSSIYTTYVYRPGGSYAQALARWRKLKHAASEVIAQNRGTISHQHGVGRDHAPWLPVEKGPLGMAALRSLAQHFDPEGRLAPGVLLED
ncbi:glycolate oxidase, subunit GlcD [compost metagenome]